MCVCVCVCVRVCVCVSSKANVCNHTTLRMRVAKCLNTHQEIFFHLQLSQAHISCVSDNRNKKVKHRVTLKSLHGTRWHVARKTTPNLVSAVQIWFWSHTNEYTNTCRPWATWRDYYATFTLSCSSSTYSGDRTSGMSHPHETGCIGHVPQCQHCDIEYIP